MTKYHAGMGQAERKQMQDDFVFDYTSIVVATNMEVIEKTIEDYPEL